MFDKIKAIAELGHQLSLLIASDDNIKFSNTQLNAINTLLRESVHYNAWFTPENVRFCLHYWSNTLTYSNLSRWMSYYNLPNPTEMKNIGLVLAGNIPMIGFHDILCVLLSGHRFIAKCSSADDKLLPAVMNLLCDIEPQFTEQITFTDSLIRNADAFIATGSNNSGRYFDFYFQKYPHIIRKNRNSIAILTGKETFEQLQLLGDDIFRYFGLGCRSVSKIYLPKGYDLQLLPNALEKWEPVRFHHKYLNNYEYNKAIYLINGDDFLDTGFLLLKHDSALCSPISVLFYDYYSSVKEMFNIINQNKEQLQCVVSDLEKNEHIPFGQTQMPSLWDYADNVDTMKFLMGL